MEVSSTNCFFCIIVVQIDNPLAEWMMFFMELMGLVNEVAAAQLPTSKLH